MRSRAIKNRDSLKGNLLSTENFSRAAILTHWNDRAILVINKRNVSAPM